MNDPSVDMPSCTVQELVEIPQENRNVLDVRQPDEFETAHVPGAVLIPLMQLPERITEIPEGDPLYVICAAGGRSAKAIEFLQPQVSSKLINVLGGTNGWIEAGYVTETGS